MGRDGTPKERYTRPANPNVANGHYENNGVGLRGTIEELGGGSY